MDRPLGAGLIDAGSNIISTAMSMFYNDYHDKLNYERQQQAIADQRAYDSPAAQMSRFRAAGLNPNLIYGQMGNSAPVPAQAEAPPSPYAKGTNMLAVAQAKKQAEVMDSQIEMNKSQANYFDSKARESDANTDFYTWRQNLYDSGIKLNEAKTDTEKEQQKKIMADTQLAAKKMDEVASNIDYLNALAKLTDEKARSEKIENMTRHALNQARINELNSQYKLNDAQASRARADATYAWKSLSDRLSIIANNKEMSEAQKKQAAAAAVQTEIETLRKKIGTNEDGDLNVWGYAMAILNDIASAAGPVLGVTLTKGSAKVASRVATSSRKVVSTDDSLPGDFYGAF